MPSAVALDRVQEPPLLLRDIGELVGEGEVGAHLAHRLRETFDLPPHGITLEIPKEVVTIQNRGRVSQRRAQERLEVVVLPPSKE